MIYESNGVITYSAYELPGAMACATCGHLMLAHDDHATYHVGQTEAVFKCVNACCSDKGTPLLVKFKRHTVEVTK
jgi:hypothetical protein